MSVKSAERRLFLKKALLMGGGFCTTSILAKYLTHCSAYFAHGNDMQPAVLPDVVIGRDDAIVADNGNVKESKITNILHAAVMQLTGSASKEHAWQRLFRPSDIVGIKLNCLSGRIMSPHVAIVDAILHGLKFAGVKDENIIVFERYNRELEAAGFRVRRATKGVQCFGTDELPQGGYDSEPQIAGSVGTCFSKIVSQMCTAIINVPVLKDHDLAGISVAMKNFFGAMHNPNKYHTNNCNPYIAELNSHPYIANKVRLIVCDAILSQYNGGPGYKPQWTWNYNGIIVGRDPVAFDRICHTIIEDQRKKMKFPSLQQARREPKYISTAAMLGLGTDDLSKINLVSI
ncbi:MAG: DUF362 domain-containing protein [Candidatus Kuenenia sp.]|nr:DUF362 domain-containing protein [Candidatus Kuenenia sp.]